MSLYHRTGSLFDGKEPALAHGVNCRGKMGSGIAIQFRQRYPEMYAEYASMCNAGMLDLGQVFHWMPGEDDTLAEALDWTPATDGRPHVFNLATQVEPGPDARLSGVLRAVQTMLETCTDTLIESVGIPRIGCGIGGLKWPHVEGVLIALTERYPSVDLFVYTLPEPDEKRWQRQ